ncbi:MAG: hypothetical protein ACQEUT_01490 [Bacillota bacterium]
MYKLILNISVFTLIYFIIWVGVDSIPIKVMLGMIGLTLLPKVRKKLYQTQLVIRKSKVALFTSVLLTLGVILPDIDSLIKEPGILLSDFSIVIFIFSTSMLGTFLYGIPVSLFSDLITANGRKYRFYLSFLVHIGFGLLSFLFLGALMNIAVLCALIFFLIDEFLRKKEYSLGV